MTDQSQFAREFLAEAKKKGSQKAMMSDIVGMPDAEDKENIRKMLIRYDKKYPGYIQNTINEARADFQAQGGQVAKYGEVNKQAHGRTLFELPEELVHNIEQAYPTMFRDRKHFQWFVKNFKELLIPEKY